MAKGIVVDQIKQILIRPDHPPVLYSIIDNKPKIQELVSVRDGASTNEIKFDKRVQKTCQKAAPQ